MDLNNFRITTFDPADLPSVLPWETPVIANLYALAIDPAATSDAETPLVYQTDWDLIADEFTLLTDQTGKTITVFYTPNLGTGVGFKAVRGSDLDEQLAFVTERLGVVETNLLLSVRLPLGPYGKLASVVPVDGMGLVWENGKLVSAEVSAPGAAQAAQEAIDAAAAAAQSETNAGTSATNADQDAAAAAIAAAAAVSAAASAQSALLVFKGPWVTATQYQQYDLVTYQGDTYHCEADHVSDADFAVDLAAGRWLVFAESDFNRNLSVPVDTTGTPTAYAISLPDPPPAPFVGLAGVIKPHLESGLNPTLDIGFGPWPIQIIDEINALNNVTPGLLGAFESFSFVVQSDGGAGYVVEITSQPLRELVAGPLLFPLLSQTGDFDTLIEGGEFQILGNWSNGPLGVAATDYDPVNAFTEIKVRGTFIQQTVFIDRTTWVEEFVRYGRAGVWSDWQSSSGVWSNEIDSAGLPSVVFNVPLLATKHTVHFFALDVDGSNSTQVRMGFNGVPYSSGYRSSSGTSGGESSLVTDSFILYSTSRVIDGPMNIFRLPSGSYTQSHSLSASADLNGGGSLINPGQVNQILVETAGSNNFLSGSIVVHSEYR